MPCVVGLMEAALHLTQMRETPLDVLTRAASLVACTDANGVVAAAAAATERRNTFKGPSSSSNRDLQETVTEADSAHLRRYHQLQEQSTFLLQQQQQQHHQTCDAFHDASRNDVGSRRTAATQTSFSSLIPFSSYYPASDVSSIQDSVSEEEPCLILDLDQQMVKPSHPSSCLLPLTGMLNAISPVREVESNNSSSSSGPLNLTTSVGSRSGSGGQDRQISLSFHWCTSSSGQNLVQSSRLLDPQRSPPSRWPLPPPSVKREHSSFSNATAKQTEIIPRKCFKISDANGGTSQRKSPPTETSQRNYIAVESNSGIDEHFRRSLGLNYSKFFSEELPTVKSMGTSNSPEDTLIKNVVNCQPPVCHVNKSVTGAVDEHFAKSLGPTWSRINSQGPSISSAGNLTTVEDHFAKALGDTWFKLKAANRNT